MRIEPQWSLQEGAQPALDQRRIGQHPAVQGRVVHLEAALPEQLLDVTLAQGIAQVPRDGLQDQCRLEVPALEVILGPTLQLLGKGVQEHAPPPVRRGSCGPHAQRGVNAKTLRQAQPRAAANHQGEGPQSEQGDVQGRLPCIGTVNRPFRIASVASNPLEKHDLASEPYRQTMTRRTIQPWSSLHSLFRVLEQTGS